MIIVNEEEKEMRIQTSTIIRTIVLAITLINNCLTMAGCNPMPFSEDELYEFLSNIATIAASIWAWWENNSFTKEAIEADKVLEELKTQNKNTESESEEGVG